METVTTMAKKDRGVCFKMLLVAVPEGSVRAVFSDLLSKLLFRVIGQVSVWLWLSGRQRICSRGKIGTSHNSLAKCWFPLARREGLREPSQS